MIGKERHIIQQASLEMVTPRGDFALSGQLNDWFKRIALPEMEKVLDEMLPPGYFLRTDVLELELPTIPWRDAEVAMGAFAHYGTVSNGLEGGKNNLLELLLEQLRAQISLQLEKREGESGSTPTKTHSLPHRRLEQWLFFLQNGRQPWWGAAMTPWSEWQIDLLQSLRQSTAFRNQLTTLFDQSAAVKQRLLFGQRHQDLLEEWIKQVPAARSFWKAWKSAEHAIQQWGKEQSTTIQAQSWLKAGRETIWHHLLGTSSTLQQEHLVEYAWQIWLKQETVQLAKLDVLSLQKVLSASLSSPIVQQLPKTVAKALQSEPTTSSPKFEQSENQLEDRSAETHFEPVAEEVQLENPTSRSSAEEDVEPVLPSPQLEQEESDPPQQNGLAEEQQQASEGDPKLPAGEQPNTSTVQSVNDVIDTSASLNSPAQSNDEPRPIEETSTFETDQAEKSTSGEEVHPFEEGKFGKETTSTNDAPLAHQITDEPAIAPTGQGGSSHSRAKPPQLGDSFYCQQAGMVIAHPFLPQLLANLGLWQEAAFPDNAAQARAVQLIYYLGHGELNPPEEELLLAKLLVGWPLEAAPPYLTEPLTEVELQEVDQLLKVIIEHWGAIGQASPAGLREGFFAREAKMSLREMGWSITVERKAQDLLLGKLPWGIGIIKCPWHESIIQVNW